MNTDNRKGTVFAYLNAALIVSVSMLFAVLVLRNLGSIVGLLVGSEGGGKFDFALIFSQTRDARLNIHWFFPCCFGVLFFSCQRYFFTNIKSKAVRVTLLALMLTLFIIIGSVVSLVLTRVNGIRFSDLLFKLIPLIDKL